MNDLPEFPDLARRTADTVTPPAFDELVDRARRRTTRRVAMASAVAAVVVVAGVGLTLELGHGSQTAPPTGQPTATPSPTVAPDGASVAKILADGHLVSVAGRHGDILTVRTLCAQGHHHCASAWQLRTSSGTSSGLVGGRSPRAYVSGDQFVASGWNLPGVVVHADGTTAPLRRVGRLTSAPDGFVHTGSGAAAVDSADATMGSLPPIGDVADIAEGVVTPDGTVVALPLTAGPAPVKVATYADGRWSTRTLDEGNVPAALVTGNDRVAALAGIDGKLTDVGTLAVSVDGRNWAMLHPADLPFSSVTSMAATDTGTLYLGTRQGLFRSADATWTRFTRVPIESARLVASMGDQVVVRTGADSYTGLDADGHATDLGDLR